jgi:hypothetical protein
MPLKLEEIFKLDYEKTLAAIDKYDSHVQEIKNWSITACGAILLLGLERKSVAITSLAIFVAIGFCFVALVCKTFLIAAWNHAKELEKLFRSGKELESPYQFGLVLACPSRLTLKGLWRTARDPIGWHIPLFFGFIVIVTVVTDIYLWCFG